MDMSNYLRLRGWRIYRKPWEGKPAMWIHPRDNKVTYQREAIRIERESERQALVEKEKVHG